MSHPFSSPSGRTLPKGRVWPCTADDHSIDQLQDNHRQATTPTNSKYNFSWIPGLFDIPQKVPSEATTTSSEDQWWDADATRVARNNLGLSKLSFAEMYSQMHSLREILQPHRYGCTLLFPQRHAHGFHTANRQKVREWAQEAGKEEEVEVLIKHNLDLQLTEPDPSLTSEGIRQCNATNNYLRNMVDLGLKIPETVFTSMFHRTIKTGKHTLEGLIDEYHPISIEGIREILHSYPCDQRSTISDLQNAFPETVFDPEATEEDTLHRSLGPQNRLAMSLTPPDETLMKTSKDMATMKALLAEMGCDVLQDIDQLANHSRLIETFEKTDSEVAYRLKPAIDKILDTWQGIPTTDSDNKADKGFWIETHGCSGQTFLNVMQEAKVSKGELEKLSEVLRSTKDPNLASIISHQQALTNGTFSAASAMPSNTEVVVVPIIFKLNSEEIVDSALSDLFCHKWGLDKDEQGSVDAISESL